MVALGGRGAKNKGKGGERGGIYVKTRSQVRVYIRYMRASSNCIVGNVCMYLLGEYPIQRVCTKSGMVKVIPEYTIHYAASCQK